MASQIVKPALSPADAAWVAAYVASHGPIPISIGGHPATMQADGSIIIEARPVDVTTTLHLAMSSEDQNAVRESAPGWVAAWRERGGAA